MMLSKLHLKIFDQMLITRMRSWNNFLFVLLVIKDTGLRYIVAHYARRIPFILLHFKMSHEIRALIKNELRAKQK